MRQRTLINRVREQLAFKVDPDDARQVRFTHFVIEAGARSAIGELASALARAAFLSIEFARPLGCFLLQRADDEVALGTGGQRHLRIMSDDQAQLVPLRIAQHLLLGVSASGVVERRQDIDEIVVAPAWDCKNEFKCPATGQGNGLQIGQVVCREQAAVSDGDDALDGEALDDLFNDGLAYVLDSYGMRSGKRVKNRVKLSNSGEPAAMRKTMTYDQGREMHGHKILTERTGVQIYFADPHSPWQRGSNENTNGLLRQYMPKGSDLSIYSQDDLDAIALSLNTRPRARFNSNSPLVVYTRHIALLQHQTNTVN